MGGKKFNLKFEWQRKHVFDKIQCLKIHKTCLHQSDIRISRVTRVKKTRIRPEPLNAFTLQKLVLKYLNIDSSKTMEIADLLYHKGLISYPRTLTT